VSRLILLFTAASLAWGSTPSPARATDPYVRAAADSGGRLRIQRANGKPVVLAMDLEQVGFEEIAISGDGRSVGWLALYPNCCTSYPIPLKLVIYSQGRRRTFEVNGLPIWRWRFSADGRRVAFEQETVHGGIGIHYELREIASGRRIESYDPPPDPPDGPATPAAEPAPAWVVELDRERP
jgi:hypothetical protein